MPILRPKATDADKQVDEAAELIGEIVAERRKSPLYGALDGMASHPLATVRLIQRRAALKSVEGGPTVFIIGHAERLVPQESSQEAANALLKLLEEPPANTWFVLTATDAGRLLPTIRSRVVPVRLGRLTDAEVREFLAAELKPALSGAALEERVRTAEGSIGAGDQCERCGCQGVCGRRRPGRGGAAGFGAAGGAGAEAESLGSAGRLQRDARCAGADAGRCGSRRERNDAAPCAARRAQGPATGVAIARGAAACGGGAGRRHRAT